MIHALSFFGKHLFGKVSARISVSEGKLTGEGGGGGLLVGKAINLVCGEF